MKNSKVQIVLAGLLLVLILGQNALSEVFNMNTAACIVYYLLVLLSSVYVFISISLKIENILFRVVNIIFGILFPILFASTYVLNLIGIENLNIGIGVIIINAVLFTALGILNVMIDKKNVEGKKLLGIVFIVHGVLFLVIPMATFFTKWIVFGLLFKTVLKMNKKEI